MAKALRGVVFRHPQDTLCQQLGWDSRPGCLIRVPWLTKLQLGLQEWLSMLSAGKMPRAQSMPVSPKAAPMPCELELMMAASSCSQASCLSGAQVYEGPIRE